MSTNSSQDLFETAPYPPLPVEKPAKKEPVQKDDSRARASQLLMASLLGATISLLCAGPIGFGVAYAFFPKVVQKVIVQEKEKLVTVIKKEAPQPAASTTAREMESKFAAEAMELLTKRAPANCLGILKIKRGEAQRKRYLRGVIEGLDGKTLVDLVDGKHYLVQWYKCYGGTGIGVAKFDDQRHFIIEWHEDEDWPAPQKLTSVHLIKGVKIGIDGR